MDTDPTRTARNGPVTSLVRVVRNFVYGSIVAIGFVVAMLLIGALLALVVRGVHEGLSWLVRSGGGASALWEAIAATASVVAGFALLAVFVRLVVGLSRARGAARST